MKDILDKLIKKGIICKELSSIELKTRKRIKAYLGVNLNNEYCFILKIDKKSRILKKDIEEIIQYVPKINFRYKKKILISNAPICSKAKEILKDWRLF